MVLCVITGCGNRTGRDQGVGFYRIPAVVTNKGEFEEKLTAERRKEWIKAISRGDTEEKQVLESERVCGKYFASGKPAPYSLFCRDVTKIQTKKLSLLLSFYFHVILEHLKINFRFKRVLCFAI